MNTQQDRDQKIRANNERLQKAFQALKANVDATVAEWETLAMEYFAAGYMLNADVCFKRADAIRATVNVPAEAVMA